MDPLILKKKMKVLSSMPVKAKLDSKSGSKAAPKPAASKTH